MAYRCGDRELIGKLWLTYLLIDPTIRFRLRIRETDLISDRQKRLSAKMIFAHLQPGQREILNSRRWRWGRLVYVSALRLEDGELLVVISPDSSQSAISDYGHRWGIETCGMQVAACEPELLPARSATLFGMFKTRGECHRIYSLYGFRAVE